MSRNEFDYGSPPNVELKLGIQSYNIRLDTFVIYYF